jgi:phosphoserine phosphatase
MENLPAKTIALIFDFDDTLAHDSSTDYLESLGVDTRDFWGAANKGLIDSGWDPVPAYMYQLVRYSQAQAPGQRITQKSLEAFAPRVRFFDGVTTLFSRLEEFMKKNGDGAKLEFYCISSGLGDLIRQSRIAGHFTDIFASDFAYNAEGEIDFPKKVVSFTDKTRYIFQISKGLIGPEYRNKPFDVNKKIPGKDLRIPLSDMIFIGDGFTDVPCFSLLSKSGGTALAVYDRENQEKKQKAWGFIEDGRVKNMHSANYKKGSDLMDSIEACIHSILTRARTAYIG